MPKKATAKETGLYEVRLPWDTLIDIGDRGILEEGATRIHILARRETGGWLSLYDWGGDLVEQRLITRVSTSPDEKALFEYSSRRRGQYADAVRTYAQNVEGFDLQKPRLRTELYACILGLVHEVPHLTTTDITRCFAWPYGYYNQEAWELRAKAVCEILDNAEANGDVRRLELEWPPGWGTSHPNVWVAPKFRDQAETG